MKIREIAEVIESFAPLSLQAEYDNSGLVVGRMEDDVHSALLAVDVTEEVIAEAVECGCDIIITHFSQNLVIIFNFINAKSRTTGQHHH